MGQRAQFNSVTEVAASNCKALIQGTISRSLLVSRMSIAWSLTKHPAKTCHSSVPSSRPVGLAPVVSIWEPTYYVRRQYVNNRFVVVGFCIANYSELVATRRLFMSPFPDW